MADSGSKANIDQVEAAGRKSLQNSVQPASNVSSQFHNILGENMIDWNEQVLFSTTQSEISFDTEIDQHDKFFLHDLEFRDFRDTEDTGGLENVFKITRDPISKASDEERQGNEVSELVQAQHHDARNEREFISAFKTPSSVSTQFLKGESFSNKESKQVSSDCLNLSDRETEGFTDLLASNTKFGSKNIFETCIGLIPVMKKVTPQNYGEFLVAVLREISINIQLEEFFRLLYCRVKSVSPTWLNNFCIQSFIDNLKGPDPIKICAFIVEAFELSHMRPNHNEPESMITIFRAPINFEDFLRNFFAIKVLLDSFATVEISSTIPNAIPRKSVHKAYFKISQRFSKIPKNQKESAKQNKSMISGIAQLGKVIKLVYPNLQIRRLGSRGHSKSYYLGIEWNEFIFNKKMISRLGLELPKTARRSKARHKQTDADLKSDLELPEFETRESKTPGNVIKFTDQQPTASSYSFIKASSKYPVASCQPRSWKLIAGKSPKQSIWCRINMLSSMKCLKNYNIEIGPVVKKLCGDMFKTSDLSSFAEDFVGVMNILISGNFGEKAFMHLYFTTLCLLFPIVLSSDKEINSGDKVRLRHNLGAFSSKIMSRNFNLTNVESSHLGNFLNIVRKMIHVNKMTSSQIKTSLGRSIVQEISFRLKTTANPQIEINGGRTMLQERIENAVILASKAYDSAFERSKKSEHENKNFLASVIEAFVYFAQSAEQTLLEFARSPRLHNLEYDTYDFPYQLFRRSSKSFHQICLSDPFIKELPIKVINFIVLQINKEIQNASFKGFGLQDNKLAHETFKAWWIHSALAEEYFVILGEMVGLSEKLSEV